MMKWFSKFKQYLSEVWMEVNPKNGNVIWPGKKEILGTTGAVIVTILIAAVYIGLIDFIFNKILGLIFK